MKVIGPRIIVALDHGTDQEILEFASRLDPELCRVKIGSILYTHYGPSLVEKLIQLKFSVFLDLKFHDIPQTVAGACRSAAELGVWMVNVHVSGGKEMMMAARSAVSALPESKRPLLIGVTVLTSLNESDLSSLGCRDNIQDQVMRLAQLAYQSGLDGVVCSAQEAAFLRKILPREFILVTPGIRLPEDDSGDQKRIMTPHAAILAGADYLVIGRSVTQSSNPSRLLKQIHQEITVL